MTSILSTKKLTPSQKEHLLNANLAVVDFDFIKTEAIPFNSPKKEIEHAIFTSIKGVQVVFEKNIVVKKAYCVGKRTAALLNTHNVELVYTGDNAKQLGEYLVNNEKDKKFHYFCAKARLATLPDRLTEEGIQWEEIPVYKTIFTSKKYKQQFDGVLFYSPSGVESYFSVNTVPIHSFCIGETTANAVKKYTKSYTVASKPSVENVLVKAIKYFKK